MGDVVRLSWLDHLPAWARHLLIVAGATAGGSSVEAVLAARGLTGVDWPDAAVHAVDAAGVAVAARTDWV